MANAVSTAGMNVKWCVESTAGTKPSTGFTVIPGCKAIPEMFNDPNTLQTTPLSATQNHTYIKGLGDTGGSVAITVNDYAAFRTAWAACMNPAGAWKRTAGRRRSISSRARRETTLMPVTAPCRRSEGSRTRSRGRNT